MDLTPGPINSLIPKLKMLLCEEYNLQKGVRGDLKFLSAELEDIQAVFDRVASVPPDTLDEYVRRWARKMREVSYNMEDIIDTVLVSADGCREPIDTGGGWLKRARKKMNYRPNKTKARGDIIAAFQDIKKQVCEIAEWSQRWRIDDRVAVTATSTTADPRLPALYRNERELVGIEEPREELVRLLTQGDSADDKKQEVKVVSIVGLGGVGKTTLAKAVYNRLQEKFDCSAFVTVSLRPYLKKVFMDILLELDEANYHTVITTKPGMDESQFIDLIRVFLQNRRYLIVIDDIWDSCAWGIIRAALLYAGNGSQIITTSRKFDVIAKGRGTTTYRLNPLSHVNSERLFYKRIFGGEGNCPDIKLAEVSDKILKECSGLPLAIITVASVLATKPWEEWSEVYNSIALRPESNRYMDNMRKVLAYSFYDLLSHLWVCLFHLSIFPENCFIEKDFLIRKWVAEGFVRKKPGMSLFESGESYFNELVNRNTIQVAEECLNKGRLYGCRVHPVLFSQIRDISTEENFCTVLEDEHHILPGNINPRRIGMHSIRNVEHNMEAVANISIEKVWSFNASLCSIDQIPPLSSFQVLRMLALEYCPGMNSNHLKMIGKLVHLRYLGLVGAGVLELPEETLGGLRLFLQTLDLRETDIEQWPSTISNLQQLMCLCVHRTRAVPEGMMERLRYSLEDLRLHLISGDTSKFMAELGRLECLRVLVLGFEKIDVELEKSLLESLRKLPKIQRLEIYCEQSTKAVAWEDSRWAPPPGIRQLVVGGLVFSRLPSWINPSSLPDLSHLHLGLVIMENGDLETLGTFPELRSLLLMVDASDEQEHHITTGVVGPSGPAFKTLNFFSTNVAVRFESGLGGPLMPNLEHVDLHVRVAQCADSWLSSLAHLRSLEKVTVALDCRGASAVEIEEAEEKLRSATSFHPIRRLRLEVTKQTGNDEVPLIEQFRFRNPRFEALRYEMEKMQADRQVQILPNNDSDEEIAPAKAASE